MPPESGLSLLEREGAGREPTDDDARASLREAALDGVRWISIARFAAEAIALVSGVVLAHLVPPAAFGRFAVAVIVNEFALALANEGVGSPLVQRRIIERGHVESAALVGIVAGVLLAAATVLVAPFACTPLFGSETTHLIQLFSPAFAFAGAGIVPLALLQRKLDFRSISVVEVASIVVTAITSIALALAGLDAEAYVIGAVAGTATWALLLIAISPKVVPRWHTRGLREVTRFGLPAGLAGAAYVGQRNIDYVILGARLSAAQVGYYYRAFTIGVGYEQKLSGIIGRVLFPVYARTNDRAHMLQVRARIVRVNAALVFPLLALFVAIAPQAVPFVFGSRWEPAVVPAQVLAVAGMIGTVANSTSALVLAAGRPRALLAFSTWQTALYGAAVFVSASHGVTAVCVAVVLVQLSSLIVAYRVMLRRVVGISLRELAHDLAPAGCSSLLVLVAAVPSERALHAEGLPAPAIMAAVGALAAAVYIASLRRISPRVWADLCLLAARMIRRKKAAPATAPAAAPATSG